jgi:hypothetical protein
MMVKSMPKKKYKSRGGVLRYRTISLGHGDYAHIAIVRKRGPRGGRTIAGRIRHRKRHRR